MAVLTRADIINGKKNIQTIHFDEVGGKLKLRPLTDCELQRVIQTMNMGALKNLKAKPIMKGKELDREATLNTLIEDVDLTEAGKYKYRASLQAIKFSLDHDDYEDKFTEEDIGSFPPGSVDVVASKVFEISGVDDPDNERVKRFRKRK